MKEVIRRIFILYLLLQISNINTFGQYQFVDYMPGYYITNTNDTIRGYIGLPSFPDSSTIILFKSDQSSQTEFIKASETKSYKRDNSVYITKEFKLTNKVDSFFVKPIIEDRLSLYRLWIHVYDIPDYKDKRYLYLSDREGYSVSLNDIPNYFKKITILKLENSDYLVLPERQSNYILSKYLSEYPGFALKIIDNDFGKGDIELLVNEFNKKYSNDLCIEKQDSIAAHLLEKRLNKYSDSRLSFEISVAYNLIKYKYLNIRGIDDLNLHSVNLQNDISYGIGLKYSVLNSFKIKVGWQTDRTVCNLDYAIANTDRFFYTVKETFGIRRHTGNISLMNEGRFHFIAGGIELEKYKINSVSRIVNYLNPPDSFDHPLPDIFFEAYTNVNFQLFAGLKVYTNSGLRMNPYISFSYPSRRDSELSSTINLMEISVGLILEFKILKLD
ncbi:hypothetical protein [Saccharicrinis sp. FJH54]|uniref:hypothetical protein n=1 Tax=Saccharicrinis sp. FJH54 TaxID=3344665 RepID=UPI0035D520EE